MLPQHLTKGTGFYFLNSGHGGGCAIMRTTSLNRNFPFALKTSCLWRQNQLPSRSTETLNVQQILKSDDPYTTASAHACVLKSGLLSSTTIANHLINCYVKQRNIDCARQLFDEMPEPNVVSWTSLMSGYINVAQPAMAVWIYSKMMLDSLSLPNEFTLTTLIKACSVLADLRTGRKVHAHVEMVGLHGHLVVCSSLVDMYGKCNDIDEARRVFNSMTHKNIVTWTSMIAAYAWSGRGHDALHLFMEFNNLMLYAPNHFMLASIINACASSGSLVSGKISHGAVIRSNHYSNDVVASALVDMYTKCGCFNYCEKVFRRIENPSVIPYTSIIVGAAKYGLGMLSLELLEEMVDRRVKPNGVTLLGVLHACSHSGLINEGLEILEDMHKKYNIIPDARHYTCVVDMLGRTGQLDRAYELAKSMQVSPEEGALLWGTLLSASRLYGRIEIAAAASNQLIESRQQLSAAYAMMANAYAMVGDWENAHGRRFQLRRSGVRKEQGCSWIEYNHATYVFYAGDLQCPRANEVVHLLKELEGKMKVRGYAGCGMGFVFVEVEEEGKEEIVGLHSERLALGFGLISAPKWFTIRIMKNLRMCGACHEAFKLISEIVDREFIVRDVNRFHHFKDGCCTCSDFW